MASVTPKERALLEAIALKESRGAYDVIFGGSRFTDFSDHPRKYVTIPGGPNRGRKSSAAGKYQFLASTWDEYANRLNLKDFSPASQDAAALQLARDAYKRKTGKELSAALEEGDYAGIGRNLSHIWTSLPKGIESTFSSDEFAATLDTTIGNMANDDLNQTRIFMDVFDRQVETEKNNLKTSTFTEEFQSGIRENPLVIMMDRPSQIGATDPEFDAIQHIDETLKPYAWYLYDSRNKATFDARVKRIVELEQMKELQTTTGGIIGSFVYGALSPTMLIPGAGLGKVIKGTTSIVDKAVKGAGLAGTAIGIDEALLHKFDPTRTKEESVYGILGGAAAGALLSAGGAAFAKKLGGEKFRKKLQADLEREVNPRITGKVAATGAVAAAITMTPGQEAEAAPAWGKLLKSFTAKTIKPDSEFALAGGKGFKAILKATRGLNPKLRTLTASSPKALEMANKLFTHNFNVELNLKGLASPENVESLRTKQLNMVSGKIANIQEIYSAAKIGDDTFQMTEKEFFEAVGRSARDPKAPAHPQVKKAVQEWEDYKKRLIERGVAEEEIKPLIFRPEEILIRQKEFKKILMDHYNATGKYDQKELSRSVTEITDLISGASRSNTVLGFAPRIKTGALKGQLLDVPTKELDDFLENDFEAIFRRFARQVETDLAEQKAFGGKTLPEMLKEVEDDYNNLIDKQPDEFAKKKMLREKQRIVSDLKALGDINRGTYKLPDNRYGVGHALSEVAKTFSLMTTGGGIPVTSLIDASAVAVEEIVEKTMGPVIVGLADVVVKAKLTKDSLRFMGVNIERINASRALDSADFDDLNMPTSGASMYARKGAEFFNQATGMNLVNDTGFRLSVQARASTLYKRMVKWQQGTLPEDDVQHFLRNSITAKDRDRILKALDKHAELEDGVLMLDLVSPGTKTDKFQVMLLDDLYRTILKPGIADRPLVTKGPLGSVLGQYMGFGSKQYNDVFLPTLQRGDMAYIARMGGMVALGSQIYVIKELLAGREPNLEMSNLIKEGIDRSGVLGMLNDIHSRVESLTGYGVHTLFDLDPTSRQRMRTRWSGALGPFAGQAENFFDASRMLGRKLFDDQYDGGFAKKATRLIPFQNAWYLIGLKNQLVKKLEE